MKAISLLTFVLIATGIFSQQITLTTSGGPCEGTGTTVLDFYDVRNGKNSFAADIGGGNISIIEWNNNQWENNVRNSITDVLQLGPLFINSADTGPNPPCFSAFPEWETQAACTGTSITNLIGDCSSLPIPTLSQWGIIALGMLSIILGVVTLKYSKRYRLQGNP